MFVKSHSGAVPRGGWLARTQTVEELRRSFLLHVQRPVILLVVIGGAVLQFGIQMWLGRRQPSSADLSGMFAAPPVDSFTWSPSVLGVFALLPLFVIRVLVIWLFICLVLEIRPSGDSLLRTSGGYLLSVLTFGLLSAALAVLGPVVGEWLSGFVGSGGNDPYLAAPRFALGLVFVFAFVPLLILCTVAIAPFLARLAARQGLKPRLSQMSLWLLSAFSVLLYIPTALGVQEHPDLSSGSFARAFGVLSLQSLIFAAIVHTTAGSAARRTLAE